MNHPFGFSQLPPIVALLVPLSNTFIHLNSESFSRKKFHILIIIIWSFVYQLRDDGLSVTTRLWFAHYEFPLRSFLSNRNSIDHWTLWFYFLNNYHAIARMENHHFFFFYSIMGSESHSSDSSHPLPVVVVAFLYLLHMHLHLFVSFTIFTFSRLWK